MKQVITIAFVLGMAANGFAQVENSNIFNRFYNNQIRPKSAKKELQLFAEINPQFFAFGGFGGGLGVEFSRFQTGFIYLKTKLTPGFRDAIFNDAQNLDVPKNWALKFLPTYFYEKIEKDFTQA